MDNNTYTTGRKKRGSKKWIILIALLLFAYVFWQAYLVNFNGVDTIKAVEGYLNDSIISQGIICRDEIVLQYSSGGSVDYLINDGERVSKGSVVANVYANRQDVDNLIYLRNRKDMLDDIKTSVGYLDGSAMDVSVARKQLANELTKLAQINATGDYTNLYTDLNGLIFGLNKIAIATNRAKDFSFAQAQIESEVSSVESKISSVIETLHTPYTGYFISDVDGYENIATVDNFANLSFEEGQAIIAHNNTLQSDGSAYGKIITDYKWSICTYIDSDKCSGLYEGKNVNVSISMKENTFNKAVIKKMVNLGDKTLIVAQCSIMSTDSAVTRLCDCEILFKQYRGIKIPKTAIHFENDANGDNQMGVYVNFSNVVQFKKIAPLYEDENYVIVPLTTSRDNQVKLYDSIIVKGRNLYDGKYL